jgi:hypothetical protein
MTWAMPPACREREKHATAMHEPRALQRKTRFPCPARTSPVRIHNTGTIIARIHTKMPQFFAMSTRLFPNILQSVQKPVLFMEILSNVLQWAASNNIIPFRMFRIYFIDRNQPLISIPSKHDG